LRELREAREKFLVQNQELQIEIERLENVNEEKQAEIRKLEIKNVQWESEKKNLEEDICLLKHEKMQECQQCHHYQTSQSEMEAEIKKLRKELDMVQTKRYEHTETRLSKTTKSTGEPKVNPFIIVAQCNCQRAIKTQ